MVFDKAQQPTDCLGGVGQCEHATSSWINSPDPVQSNSKEVFLDFFANWIESKFPRPKMETPSWLFIFWPIRSKFNSIQSKKLNWIHFFSSLQGALIAGKLARTNYKSNRAWCYSAHRTAPRCGLGGARRPEIELELEAEAEAELTDRGRAKASAATRTA